MSRLSSGHVSSDRLGEAARHAGLDGLREAERLHVEGCEQCRRLYAGYRLTDRLLAAEWRQVALPASALVEKPIRSGLSGRLRGLSLPRLSPRSLVPAALALCLAALVGLAFVLPQFIPVGKPAASGSTAAEVQPTPSPSSSVTPKVGPTASSPGTPFGSAGPGQSSGTGPESTPAGTAATPTKPVTPVPQPPDKLAALPGWPIAWAPDGAHLMVAEGSGFTAQRSIEILNSAGRETGSISADSATWVDSRTIAFAGHGKLPGAAATISLANVSGHVIGTLAGHYSESGAGSTGAILLGSGTGELAVATQGGWGPAASAFVIWDGGTVGDAHEGVPIAFSQDGTKLAVLHPTDLEGGSMSGWLEIVAAPSLHTIASYAHVTVRISTNSAGPGYAPDAAFSPDGNWLLVSGSLVDLTRGKTTQVGDGGWLPNGVLITSSGGTVLSWEGARSTPDSDFPAGGSIATSRHGDVVEFFGDGRPPLQASGSSTCPAWPRSTMLNSRPMAALWPCSARARTARGSRPWPR